MVLGISTKCLWTGVKLSKRTSLRSIHMSSVDLDKVMEKLETNPYYEKYAQRIAELQRTSPEEFVQRAESVQRGLEAEQRARRAPPDAAAPLQARVPDTRQFSSVLNPKEAKNGDASVEEKKLENIFKIELVKDKEASEIQSIWENYHRNKEVISATIPIHIYSDICSRMKKYPTFLFPLPRSQGYEFVMSQCHGHSVHFTPLLAFQVHKENAPECLTMVHYTELQHKGLVLMRGDFDTNVLNGQEAQCLANQFQMYYNGKDPVKTQLLQTFTEKPQSFKHMDLVSQLENVGLV